jgi:hypothetical protein
MRKNRLAVNSLHGGNESIYESDYIETKIVLLVSKLIKIINKGLMVIDEQSKK